MNNNVLHYYGNFSKPFMQKENNFPDIIKDSFKTERVSPSSSKSSLKISNFNSAKLIKIKNLKGNKVTDFVMPNTDQKSKTTRAQICNNKQINDKELSNPNKTLPTQNNFHQNAADVNMKFSENKNSALCVNNLNITFSNVKKRNTVESLETSRSYNSQRKLKPSRSPLQLNSNDKNKLANIHSSFKKFKYLKEDNFFNIFKKDPEEQSSPIKAKTNLTISNFNINSKVIYFINSPNNNCEDSLTLKNKKDEVSNQYLLNEVKNKSPTHFLPKINFTSKNFHPLVNIFSKNENEQGDENLLLESVKKNPLTMLKISPLFQKRKNNPINIEHMVKKDKFHQLKLDVMKVKDKVKSILGDLKKQQILNEGLLKIYVTNLKVQHYKRDKGIIDN